MTGGDTHRPTRRERQETSGGVTSPVLLADSLPRLCKNRVTVTSARGAGHVFDRKQQKGRHRPTRRERQGTSGEVTSPVTVDRLAAEALRK